MGKTVLARTLPTLHPHTLPLCCNYLSKMPTHWLQVESCRAGFKSGGKDQLNALFSVGTMKADTDSASAESVKLIQGRVAHGTLYVRLTCPTMDNRHNKPRSSSRILTVRNFKFNLRNKIKSVDRAFLDFPCPQAWWSLNKPSGCTFGLANDSTKPFGHGKSKKARLSRLYSYMVTSIQGRWAE